ncbi:MAG: TIM44-like domain-containing protein [Kofleriaceae bacterium]
MIRDRRACWLALIVVAFLVGDALARPGGGGSYSGGGGHGGGGGGGGGDGDGFAILELLYWLIRLAIEVLVIGVPLIGLVVAYFIYQAYKRRQNKDWDSGPPVALERAVEVRPEQLDAEFSHVLFEDFVFRLVSTAQRARHSEATLATVAPYVSQAAREALATRDPVGAPVESVIVGALRTVGIDRADGRDRIAVELELNVTTAAHTSYSVETWTFERAQGRDSKPPGATRGFPCPNCGAPWQAAATGTQQCASCGEIVDNGRFDWTVAHIALRSIDERPPTLTEEVPERGTDLPTYRQPGAERALLALEADDPAITDALLLDRLAMIYEQLNRAWSANDLRPVRGLVSAGLYDYLSYWVEAYTRQGLRNKLEDMRITHREIAKVTRDHYYDAITVRIWGTGKDTVVRADSGEHVRGARTRERKYSEYWTLIRSTNRKGPPATQPVCSNCGAPLQITMAGECEHCSAYLVAGEFDWVLSKVEQDDSYRGLRAPDPDFDRLTSNGPDFRPGPGRASDLRAAAIPSRPAHASPAYAARSPDPPRACTAT